MATPVEMTDGEAATGPAPPTTRLDPEVRVAFTEAVRQSILILGPLCRQLRETQLVWTKTANGSWHGQYEDRPGVREAFRVAHKELERVSERFVALFRERYPRYTGLVGAARFGWINLGHDIGQLVRSAIGDLWSRNGGFDNVDSTLNQIADEFEKFIIEPHVRFKFQAHLLNFQMPLDYLQLAEELAIRRLTVDEMSAIYGGPIDTINHFRPRSFSMDEFVLEGESRAEKSFGDPASETADPDPVRTRIDRAILCLRTFKGGPVGYHHVHMRAVGFNPLFFPTFTYGDLHVPMGSYILSTDDIEPLVAHIAQLIPVTEPAMIMACSRLADAETRTRTQDQIIDAVIGLEALLLAGLTRDDRRGELKFRFSLNYATLFNSPAERHRGFRIAKDLYDLRSSIAHGSSSGNEVVRVGDERIPFAEASRRAIEALRFVVCRFLPHASSAPYKRHDFWEKGYFGLPQQEPTGEPAD
jgi:hypothetical protein